MNPKMNRGGVLGRVIRYMLHYYKYLFALVIVYRGMPGRLCR